VRSETVTAVVALPHPRVAKPDAPAFSMAYASGCNVTFMLRPCTSFLR